MANRETLYLTLEEVLELHETLLEAHGGAAGVRDFGLIESALARPRSGYYETLADQAAALLQSFASNHAFVDGNKRVAFAACAIFLRMNDYRLNARPAEVERLVVKQVIEDKSDLVTITRWIEKGLRKAS